MHNNRYVECQTHYNVCYSKFLTMCRCMTPRYIFNFAHWRGARVRFNRQLLVLIAAHLSPDEQAYYICCGESRWIFYSFLFCSYLTSRIFRKPRHGYSWKWHSAALAKLVSRLFYWQSGVCTSGIVILGIRPATTHFFACFHEPSNFGEKKMYPHNLNAAR